MLRFYWHGSNRNNHSEHCLIKVSDNGLGIDKQHIKKIFDMFYRGIDKVSGSGLGLYIVKEHLDKLGGKISVQSELEMGTKFEIEVPNLLDYEGINPDSNELKSEESIAEKNK